MWSWDGFERKTEKGTHSDEGNEKDDRNVATTRIVVKAGGEAEKWFRQTDGTTEQRDSRQIHGVPHKRPKNNTSFPTGKNGSRIDCVLAFSILLEVVPRPAARFNSTAGGSCDIQLVCKIFC